MSMLSELNWGFAGLREVTATPSPWRAADAARCAG